MSSALNIKKILFNKYSSLSELCYFSQKLSSIDSIFKELLIIENKELVAHCRVSSIINNCLTIETSRSEYLTSLKFNSPQLLSKLRINPELSQIITIKYKVCPSLEKKQNQLTKNQIHKNMTGIKLSNNSKESLIEIADKISNQELKQALLKLAVTGSSQNAVE